MEKEKNHINSNARTLLLGLLVLLVAVLALMVYQEMTSTDTDNETSFLKVHKTTTPTTTSTVTATSTADVTVNWKTYTDSTFDFNLKYPIDAILSKTGGETVSNSSILFIQTYDLSKNYDEMGYDKDQLTKLRDDLASGTVKTDVAGLSAKTARTYAEIDVCNVEFKATAQLFSNNTYVKITWRYNNPSDLVSKNPTYFVKDSVNDCPDKIWKFTSKGESINGIDKFKTDIAAGNTDAVSQKWYTEFNQILSTFKFTK